MLARYRPCGKAIEYNFRVDLTIRKGGSHRRQGAVADRYNQPVKRYSCFGRLVQLDRADGTLIHRYLHTKQNVLMFRLTWPYINILYSGK